MHRRHHTILEAVTALILLIFVVTAIATTMRAAGTARLRTAQTARSLLVLENVVQRLAAQPAWSQTDVDRLLRDEFAAVTVPRADGLTPRVQVSNGVLGLSIEDARGRPTARVNLPAKAKETP